ncbi:tigger transposable element-derived protein 6-like protein [Perkinsela sp. CCAP 1560/4]|nr:tigger transposable element-derived protein 6-like protein [Perkinsela sp. CCAP 1560/4]|eukprot:KNH07221.1 tigger transposable element-derived protein 6-like protein [Perkinsela sp. CCAP 1560/4]
MEMVIQVERVKRVACNISLRKGAELNKEDAFLLTAQYDAENVYTMDKTRLFFGILLRYILLAPSREAKGNSKAGSHFSYVRMRRDHTRFRAPWSGKANLRHGPESVLLLLDNAPGHFGSVTGPLSKVCFHPSCTSWK